MIFPRLAQIAQDSDVYYIPHGTIDDGKLLMFLNLGSRESGPGAFAEERTKNARIRSEATPGEDRCRHSTSD